MKYRQLTLDERYQIAALLKRTSNAAEIARELGRHPTTITRELARNRNDRRYLSPAPYLPTRAQAQAKARRDAKAARSRKIQGDLQIVIEQKLRLGWSPEHISGRLATEARVSITHETIYQHVLRDAKAKGTLRYCLRFGGYRHHRFKKSRMAERTRQRKHWLDERPSGANDRTELGHWERDCVLGVRGGAGLLTLLDRKSRYVIIKHVDRVDTEHVAAATLEAFAGVRVASLTNDNGVEFQRDEALQRKLGAKIYFCDPSSPWQRGSVENANGLIRQYVPKGTSIDDINPAVASMIAETLNHRPRKVLGFRTPHEAFFDEDLPLLTEPALLRFGLEFSSPS